MARFGGLWLGVVLALCLGMAPPPRPTPSLKFEQRTHDFGALTRGEKPTARFPFVNAGDAPLVIQGVHAPCGCTVAVVESGREYQPGERGVVEVRLDTTDFAGALTKTVSVMTNEKLMPDRTLTVKASVRAHAEADPPLVDFGEVALGEGAVREIVVRPAGGFALQVTGVTADDKLVEATPKPRGDGTWAVTVRLRNDLAPQFVKTALAVKTNSPALPELPVPVRAHVKGAVEVAPRYLEFGAVAAGGQSRRTITLSGDRGVEVKGHRAELNVNGRPVATGAKLVKLEPAVGGGDRRTMTIELTNDAKHAGSVHGRLILETTGGPEREVAVDFYAFFR